MRKREERIDVGLFVESKKCWSFFEFLVRECGVENKFGEMEWSTVDDRMKSI